MAGRVEGDRRLPGVLGRVGPRPLRLLAEAVTQRYAWVPFASLLACYLVLEVRNHGVAVARWDVLLLSGWAALAVGLALAQGVPQRMRETLERLGDRGALEAPAADLPHLDADLEAKAVRWGFWAGLLVAAAILVAFAVALAGNLPSKALLVAFEMLGGFVAGFHLGRMVAYGGLGRVLRGRGFRVCVRPGHMDGAAGLKPVGDFLFYQARIAGIPALFLAVWSVLIPVMGERYAYWRDPYLGLLAVAIVFEVLAFVVPMWSFHQEMARQKRDLQREADTLSIEIDVLRVQLAQSSAAEIPDVKERLAAKTERYLAIEHMPTWPVDVGTRRRFTLRNAALVLPLVGSAAGNKDLWNQLSKVLEGFSS